MIAVFVCGCRRKRAAPSLREKIAKAVGSPHVFGHERLCGAEGLRFLAENARACKADRLLLAGCRALLSRGYAETLSRATGVSPSAIDAVLLSAANSAADCVRSIRRAYTALELLPVFETKRVPVRQEVLVVGGGFAGMEAARQVSALGYPTTIVERTDRLGGLNAPGSDFGLGAATGGAEVQVLTRTTLASLAGSVGNFSARLSDGSSESVRAFGALVIATGIGIDGAGRAPFAEGKVVALSSGLESRIERMARRERPRHVALLLDLEVDETKTSSEVALRTGLALRRRFKTEVSILLRDVRVSSLGLETLYDEARQEGVSFVKYGSAPAIRCTPAGVTIACRESIMGEEVEVSCDMAAVSPYGLPTPVDESLAAAAGVGLDAYRHLQENNVHLLPAQTNRAGVFVVGACRGETFPSAITRDARDAALSVHAVLARKEIVVELSHAVVDGDKCALCLTCIRSCPFAAMRIFAEEKRADCVPEACRRCGICAGECPNKAIELPAYSDRIVLARAGA